MFTMRHRIIWKKMKNRGWVMQKFNRIFVIVLDSLGIGEMKDSAKFGDIGVNTLQHVSQSVDSFQIPNLQKLGIANLLPLAHVEPVEQPPAYYTKLNERSQGKDTMTGHWEMMGLHIQAPFKTFTEHGFPPELIRELETRTGRKVLGNRSDSGIGIIDEFGEEQLVTGDMIIYTSADSVLQICGHEEAFGVEELYRCCEIAREITMKDEWKVGRVIARPFVGKKAGEFERTSNRHDYALKPFGPTTLTALKEADLDVIAIGKIRDIFDGEGITKALRSKTSVHGMEQTIQTAQEEFHGLCFVNLVDFDALWGHRRDPVGYAKEVEKFDEKLGTLMEVLKEEDLLIVTADHGNDPTYKGSDHTREKVPFLAYAKSLSGNGPLPEMDTFAVIGATIVENFGVEKPKGTIGESILHLLK